MIATLTGALQSAAAFLAQESAEAAREAVQAATGVATDVVATPSAFGLPHYLIVGALTFTLGMVIIITRRNAIAVLMGIELLLNSAGLNFVAFSKFVARDLVTGQVLTVFVIVLAAAEAALALAIILNIYNNMNTVEVDEADALRG